MTRKTRGRRSRASGPSGRAPIHASLKEWLTAGALGPFRIGATKQELIDAVGQPDLAGCPHNGEDAVWKYGDIELLFDTSHQPFRLYCVEMHAFDGVPSGGGKVRLEPWIVRSELPLADLVRELDALGVPHRQEVPRYGGGEILHLIVRETPRLRLDFITSDTSAWPIGLHGLWMTRT